jgi:hypothetical protein
MTPSLTVVAVPVLAEGFARRVSEAVPWRAVVWLIAVVPLRVVVWPIAVVLLRAVVWPIAVVPWPIAVPPIVAGTILIAERRSVPQQ